MSRDTFEFILREIKDLIVKMPTCMKPHPTSPADTLAVSYHLAHGCTLLTVGDCLVSLSPLLTAFFKMFAACNQPPLASFKIRTTTTLCG